jgi:hypothetical protein
MSDPMEFAEAFSRAAVEASKTFLIALGVIALVAGLVWLGVYLEGIMS